MLKKSKAFILVVLAIALYAQPALAQSEKLIFAIDIIRHGDRTPIAKASKVPYMWQQDLGQLTPKGMEQEFRLGSQLRQRYIEKEHLLPEHYSPETMYVRSTDFDRTLMSAESLLYGLYPLGTGASTLPSAFQPIPIHTAPQELDSLLLPENDKKKKKALLEKYVFSQKAWQQKSAEIKSELPRWSELTGYSVHSLLGLTELADRLDIQKRYHQPLPQGLSEQEADKIITFGKWSFLFRYQQPEIGKIAAKSLLTEMIHHLKTGRAQKSPLKYVLYSAHDSTIMGMMSALQKPLNEQPRYASDLNFALYEIDGKTIVRITLNNEPVIVPACGGNDCTIEKLESLTQ